MEKISELLRKGEKLATEQGIKQGKGMIYDEVDGHIGEVCALGMIALATVDGNTEKLRILNYNRVWKTTGVNQSPNTCLLHNYTEQIPNGDEDNVPEISSVIYKLNDEADMSGTQIADILEKCGY